MRRVRVLVANRHRLMRQLIMASIADQSDIEIVGEVESEGDVAQAVENVEPDFLIVSMDDFENHRAGYGFLLGSYPKMRILALAPEENRGLFFWASIDIRSRALESSETGILAAMRQRSPFVEVTRVQQ